jgi:FixJ family two-component response regulator
MRAAPPFVVIVDDEEPIRKALCRLLRACGMIAEGFSSGRVFLDSLAARRADCLLLDLNMPGVTGFEVLQQIGMLSRTLPTIVITGYDEPDTRANCLAAGAVGYLRKPLDEHSLLEAINSAVRNRPHSQRQR